MGPSGQQALRGALVGLLVASTASLGLLDGVERWGVNQLFALRGPISPRTPIVIVSIDEDSFDELDLQWPWPRALHAKLLDIVRQGKPAAIGLDVVFSEPSARGVEDDRALGAAIARAGNVILGAALTEVTTPLYSKEDLNPPIDDLLDRAAAFGFVNYRQDEDAYIRSASLTRTFQGEAVSGFDVHLHRLGVRAGIPSAPPFNEQTFLINYRGGPRTFPTVPYYQVVNGEVGPDVFTGKIVLVGATTPVLHDVFPTPFATHGEMPGVEIHANVLETLFQGVPLGRARRSWGVLFAFGAALLAVWLTNRCRPLVAFGLILAVALGYAVVTLVSFVKGQLVLEMAAVPLALVIGYGATVVENFIQEQRKRAMLMNLFSRHVAPEVAEAIWQQRDQFVDGGRLRPQQMTVTVLFTDLKGFTPVSEKLDTQSLLNWINDYMDVMARLIMEHGGVIDDYAGDSIKADFGVPFARTAEAEIAQDAVNATNCALAMEREIVRLKKFWQEQDQPIVGTRIGIYTGPVVAGSLGTQQRLKYTTVGDTVNTASRLESFGKDVVDPYFDKVPCRILIGAATLKHLGDRFITQRIGEVSLKGKEEKITVYRVLGRRGEVEPSASLRGDVRVNVECAVSILAGDMTLQVPTSDLSSSGLSVYGVSLKFDKEEIVPLRLTLAEGTPPIAVTAKVAWLDGDRAGFLFLDLNPDDRRAVEQFLAQCLAPQALPIATAG